MKIKRDKDTQRVLNATLQEDMNAGIDFSSTQRSQYAEKGTTEDRANGMNGEIPSVGQANKAKDFFKKTAAN